MSSSLKLPMTYEVHCGRCSERLRIEPNMETVACPHCDTVLAVPEDEALLADGPTLPVVDDATADSAEAADPAPPQSQDPPPSQEAAEATHDESPSLFDADALHAAVSDSTPDFSRWGAGSSTTSAAASAFHPVVSEPGEPPASSTPSFDFADPASEPVSDDSAQAVSPVPAPVPAETTIARSRSSRDTAAASGDTVPRSRFLAVLIYASVVTALCLGLLLLRLNSRSHQLESLPDVVPPRDEDGNISHILAPAEAPLPAGHVLALGESQRFGDLLVTPLRVTRESLDFTHRNSQGSREPAGEVFKLWLEFTNVGERGRSFAPLDAELLFYRGPSDTGAYTLRANNFLAPVNTRSPEALIAVYDHPPQSDWNLAGQDLGTVLAPGETLVTYVPTETGVSLPDGSLAWRVHLRKGIANNGWGVTTLVEVAFRSDMVSGS